MPNQTKPNKNPNKTNKKPQPASQKIPNQPVKQNTEKNSKLNPNKKTKPLGL